MSELNLENIGGLIGKHTFQFKKGLNVLNAPNSSGKTSIINGLKLGCEGDWENEKMNQYLHDKADYGKSELRFNGLIQKTSITRDKKGVSFLSRELDYNDKRTKSLCFLMKDSPLQIAISKADEEEIKRWFYSVTDLKYYEIAKKRSESVFKDCNKKKETLENKLKGSINELKKLKKQYIDEKDNLESRMTEILKSPELEDIKDKIDILKKKIDEMDKIIDKLDADLSDNQLKLVKAEKNLNEKQEELNNLKYDLEEVKREILSGEEEIIELEEKYEINKDKITNLEKELYGYDEIVGGKTIHIEGIEEFIKHYIYNLKKKQSIKGLEICPTCDSELNPNDTEEIIKKIEKSKEEKEIVLRKKERELGELNKAQKKIIKRRNEVNEELPKKKNKINNVIDKTNSEIKGHNASITRFTNVIKEIEGKLKKNKMNREKFNQQLQDLVSPYENIEEELKELNIKIEKVGKQINDIEAKIKLMEEGTEELRLVRKKVELSEYIVRHFSNCVSKIQNVMLDKLNDKLKKSFQLLELAELDRILVTKDFEIIITRKGGYETNIAELSGAERTLIAFIIMVISKNEFLPDFPMLFIDEIGEFMDKTRFLKIIDYLTEIVDILIITRNKPLEGAPSLITQENILHNSSQII